MNSLVPYEDLNNNFARILVHKQKEIKHPAFFRRRPLKSSLHAIYKVTPSCQNFKFFGANVSFLSRKCFDYPFFAMNWL